MTNSDFIPRERLFADPKRLQVKVSPDGKHLCYLAPFEENLNLWIAPRDNLDAAQAVTRCCDPIRSYCWAADLNHLLYIHDTSGNENWRIFSYCLSTQETKCYTPKQSQAQIIKISHKFKSKILITHNQRDPHYFDVYELDLLTQKQVCLYENNQYWDFIADDDFNLRLAICINEKLQGEYLDLRNPKSPKVVATLDEQDLFNLYYYPKLKCGLANDNKTLIVVQSVQYNTSSLVSLNLENNETQFLGNQPDADILDILYHPQTKFPCAYAVYYQRKRWIGLNEQVSRQLSFLQSFQEGDLTILSQTSDNKLWTISYQFDDKEEEFYFYWPEQNKITLIFKSEQQFKDYTLTKMRALEILMRDGLKCVSYLSLPVDCQCDEEGWPIKALPTVLCVHGGPNFRDFWGFQPVHQWLANRGYAVLSVNYRGSSTFGKQHMKAGYGQWATGIQDDLIDAVNYLIHKGVTEKEKVAIIGRSFGGYSTLVALTRTPDFYCCGADLVGMANLSTMLKCFPPYWRPLLGLIYKLVGVEPGRPEAESFLRTHSPLFHAHKIRKPLLIGHGMNDPRIHQSESDAMVEAMQKNQIPVTYVVFPDEGHQLSHPANREAFYAWVEAFLAKSFKNNNVQPMQDNKTATMQIKVNDFNV